jgi:predicted ATPase
VRLFEAFGGQIRTLNLEAPSLDRAGIFLEHHKVAFKLMPESPHKTALGKYFKKLYENIMTGQGLLLWGGFGRGKTSMGVLLAMAVLRRGGRAYVCRYPKLRDIKIDKLLLPSVPEQESIQEIWEAMHEVDLLVVDEIKPLSGESIFIRELFEELIRYRAGQKLATVLISNFGPKGIGPGEAIEDIIGPGSWAVLKPVTEVIPVMGKDWRKDTKP